MQQGSIVNIHIARVKGTPSDPVQEANAISGMGLEGDRSCKKGNMRQVLLVDKETLDEFELKPGQIKENITTTGVDMSQTEPGQVFFIGDHVTMEIVGECEPCGKMNALQPGLLDKINHRRGMLAMVINGGSFKVGDSIRLDS
ncbi:MAG TPA: MOSC domain-containing protein [Dehalococcoidia bacterium]|nr:MOSC domain-containing protein [Dehalococcoidia bacterium]